MIKYLNRMIIFMTLAGASTASHSQTVPSETRGALLYNTHCISCHTSQMHWRNDKKS